MVIYPKWATTPLGYFSPRIDAALPRRSPRRPREKCETPTPFEAVVVKAIAAAGVPTFAWAIADAIHATPQRRRDLHGYLKKLTNKGYVKITEYVTGLRGPPRPLFELTEKARQWLTASQ